MLQLLRINNPGLVFFSVFLAILIHALAIFFSVDFTFIELYTEPLSRLIFGPLTSWGDFSYYLLLFLGCMAQIIIAFLIDNILNNFKIISKRNYLGGMVFVLASSLDKSWLLLSPMQISLLLIVLLIRDIFNLSRQERLYKEFFNIGLAACLSVLIYFPSIFLLLFIFPALFSIRPFHIKDVARVLVGVITPLFIVVAVYFLTDNLARLTNSVSEQFQWPLLSLSFFTTSHLISFILIFVWLFLSCLFLITIPFSLAMQTRKIIGVLIMESLMCCLFFFFPTHYTIAYLLLLSPVISVFLAVVLSEMKNELIANVIFGLLMVSTFSVIIFN
jgi:hypothetical protein